MSNIIEAYPAAGKTVHAAPVWNLIGIDVPAKIIKVARIGAQYDAYLRYKDTVAINYATKTIL